LKYTQYGIIGDVAKEMDYKVTRTDKTEYDIIWFDMPPMNNILSKLQKFQRINHFPGMSQVANKSNLARNLARMEKMHPNGYSFFPKTWLLPSEMHELKSYAKSNPKDTFICKPEMLSQGKGIYLIKNVESINKLNPCIVQKYIDNPLLIDNLKFDLRIYVLLNGIDPLRIYMYKDGLARFSTEEYQTPKKGNLNNMYMHLTNYAINKNNCGYHVENQFDEEGKSHKRSLQSIWALLSKEIGENYTE
jgi:tubulin polyglutamylase TTLL6/13